MEYNKQELLTVISGYIEQKVEGFSLDLHSDASFSSLGLDSLCHVELSGVIEEHIGATIDPTFAFDYPTVNALLNKLTDM